MGEFQRFDVERNFCRMMDSLVSKAGEKTNEDREGWFCGYHR